MGELFGEKSGPGDMCLGLWRGEDSGELLLRPIPEEFPSLMELILCIRAEFLLEPFLCDRSLQADIGDIALGKFGMNSSSTFSRNSSEVRSYASSSNSVSM